MNERLSTSKISPREQLTCDKERPYKAARCRHAAMKFPRLASPAESGASRGSGVDALADLF
jgi:hypothetical protein